MNIVDTPCALDEYMLANMREYFRDTTKIYRADYGFCIIPEGKDPIYLGESVGLFPTALYLDYDASYDDRRIAVGIVHCEDYLNESYAEVRQLFTANGVVGMFNDYMSVNHHVTLNYRGTFFHTLLYNVARSVHNSENDFRDFEALIRYFKDNSFYPLNEYGPDRRSKTTITVKWLN